MKKVFFTFIIALLANGTLLAQNNIKEMAITKATADSSSFVINKQAGWQQYNSRLALINTDSVMIEMILQHDNNIDWKQKQLVGKIKSGSFFPKTIQSIEFSLLTNKFLMIVEPSGHCFLQLMNGTLPEVDPVILVFCVKYKV